MINRILYRQDFEAIGDIESALQGDQLINPLKVSGQDMIEQLKEALSNGVVRFVFQKKDGTLREATGTTKQGLVPKYSDKELELMRESMRGYTQVIDNQTIANIVVAAENLEEKESKDRKGSSDEVIVYYDLDKMSWRSCKKTSVITAMV